MFLHFTLVQKLSSEYRIFRVVSFENRITVPGADPGGGSGGEGPDPLSDMRGFLLSPLSIAKPPPGSIKMHFSEPEISKLFSKHPQPALYQFL